MAAKGAEEVTVSEQGVRDRVGDSTPGAARGTVTNAIIWPRTSTEDAARGETIIDGLNIFLPAPVPFDVKGTDVVEARGSKWVLDGNPGDFRKKNGAKVGLILVVKRLA